MYYKHEFNKNKKFELDHLPSLFEKTKNVARIAEELWQVVYKISLPIVKDVDVVSDFCLHFYERIPQLFETYKKNSNSPFIGFLKVYTKHLLKNFLRYRNRKEFEDDLYLEYYRLQKPDIFSVASYTDKVRANFLEEMLPDEVMLNGLLENVKLKKRTISKLYLGVDLTIYELKYLVTIVETPLALAKFLIERRKRKNDHSLILNNYNNRFSHLQSLLLRSNSQTYRDTIINRKRISKTKLERRLKLKEITKIAKLLKLSKSTISRTLFRVATYLSEEKNLRETFKGRP